MLAARCTATRMNFTPALVVPAIAIEGPKRELHRGNGMRIHRRMVLLFGGCCLAKKFVPRRDSSSWVCTSRMMTLRDSMLLGAMMLLLVVLLRFENGVAVVSCCVGSGACHKGRWWRLVVLEIRSVWCETRCRGELKLWMLLPLLLPLPCRCVVWITSFDGWW